MIKYSFTAILMFICLLSNGQDISVPSGYTLLDEKLGDLDKDSIPEKVIVFNTSDSTEDGTVREIRIYKKVGDKWVVFASSRNAISKSEEGGMMGDPFEGIEIAKGILITYHSGGSSWKWSNTDKYRFQNGKFQLIGYENHYGKPCEYFQSIDFNLQTGKIIYKKEYDHCEDEEEENNKNETETFYKKGIKIDLNNRKLNEIKFITPKYKEEIYL